MRHLQIALVFLFIILARGNASAASCSASAAARVDAAYKQFDLYESLFVHGDHSGAIDAYVLGARGLEKVIPCPPTQTELTARFAAITSGYSDIHAWAELNAAPDNYEPGCDEEHHDVARSNVAEAWYGLYFVHQLGQNPPRLALFERMTRISAVRFREALPAYSAPADVAERFWKRYKFTGSTKCLHIPEP
jgi:hypothetical protein